MNSLTGRLARVADRYLRALVAASALLTVLAAAPAAFAQANAIESVNARIRRAVKSRGHFPNEQAALKCVFMAIMSLDPTDYGTEPFI